MATTGLPLERLDRGDAPGYVDERLFGNSLETLQDHVERLTALAEPTRYAILYLLYEYGEVSRKRLSDETDRESNGLQQPLRKLLDANLIEEIPGPSDADGRKTFYRITPIGRQEIASDIRNIIGGTADDEYYEILLDPALYGVDADDEDRIRHADGEFIFEPSPKDLHDRQEGLQNRWNVFENAFASGE